MRAKLTVKVIEEHEIEFRVTMKFDAFVSLLTKMGKPAEPLLQGIMNRDLSAKQCVLLFGKLTETIIQDKESLNLTPDEALIWGYFWGADVIAH